jgi:hypothetical protein
MIKEHMFNLVVRSDYSSLYDSKMCVDLTAIFNITFWKVITKKWFRIGKTFNNYSILFYEKLSIYL